MQLGYLRHISVAQNRALSFLLEGLRIKHKILKGVDAAPPVGGEVVKSLRLTIRIRPWPNFSARTTREASAKSIGKSAYCSMSWVMRFRW